ncbi:hypothetical protein ACEQ8H_005835 [Pleosporales sp. CAS-2024a]
MPTFQYRDLPQINMNEPRSAGCGLDNFGYTAVYGHDSTDYYAEDNMYLNPLDNGMSTLPFLARSMQFDSPLPHNIVYAVAPIERNLRIQYEPQWPSNECWRAPSPDRLSASEYSTDASLSDAQSPNMFHTVPYGSPSESFSPSTLSYSTMKHVHDDGYASHQTLLGGSINPQVLEYEHPEFEPEDTTTEDVEIIDFNQEAAVDHDDATIKVASPASDPSDEYTDSGLGNSVRDAESVQPMADDIESDEDYSPKVLRSNKRRRSSASSGSPNRVSKPKGSSVSTTSGLARPAKRYRRAINTSKKQMRLDSDDRPFPCPFAPYGCDSSFSSKNEWKRHVSTQHIKLFYWRCDLCKPTTDSKNPKALYYNDFNRKDLYTQHVRRMHVAPKTSHPPHSPQDFPVTEENLQEHQSRCLTTLRQAPQHSCCLFCDKTFEGAASWEERMEHVGRHLEKDGKGTLHVDKWNPDHELERYLQDEGLIFREKGQWRIGDGKPIRGREEEEEEEEVEV